MSAAQALQDDSLLIVDVSRGNEGVAFALYPLSGEHLRQVAPGTHL